VVYYFWTWYQLKQPVEFDVTVPTGNFGNIFAGFIAKRMGLPLRKLVLATNENDILARFFQSGVYERGEVRFSNSPAMDIQVASNFERYLYYQLGENATDCAAFMNRFQTEKCASLNQPDGFFDWFTADAVTDHETLQSIQGIWHQFNYLADPHTAVGFHLAQKHRDPTVPMVCLATAHPAKFDDTVDSAIPGVVNQHSSLDALLGLETRKTKITDDPDALKDFIRARCLSGH
jgi:threonine synthase